MNYTINIFISHSWSYSGHYETLYSWIVENEWTIHEQPVIFHDWSVPKNDPIHNATTDKQLEMRIFAQISRANAVIIPTGMYANYSKWISKEISGSKLYRVPILAVNPRSQQRASSTVINAANELVGWNKNSVVNAIWKLYQNVQ